MNRVVITGLGWSTALGQDGASCWDRLVAGESGIAPISFWDPAEYSTKVAAEVRSVPADFSIEAVRPSSCRKSVRMFVSVAREAYRDAGFDQAPLPSTEIGLAAGTSVNYLDMRLIRQYFSSRHVDTGTVNVQALLDGCEATEEAFRRRQGDTIIGVTARVLNLRGPSQMVDTACAASAHAIGYAYNLVRRGKVSAMIAGGSAALVSPIAILAFALLGALSRCSDPRNASRPFDKHRDGFVMGEGAGAIVLESLDSARRRGARILAELVGFGSTLNAHSLTDPSPDGVSEARAMALALEEGRLSPEDIDYIAAHGTSTPKNDSTETMAIKRVFGAHAKRLCVSSVKGQIGHTISAAGVSNVIATVKAITSGLVPPTMNLRNPDAGCDLDYVPNQSRRVAVRAALANAFAFGGQNAVLALRQWDGA